MADSREPTISSDWVGSPVYKRAFRKSLLSREEEIDLIQRAQSGDRRASSELVESNIRFVQSIAKRYRIKGVIEMEDLIQEGMMGLVKTIERFDPSKGVRFSTYASKWIMAYCGRAQLNAVLVKSTTTEASRHAYYHVSRVTWQMTNELQREPTMAELAERLEVSEDVVRNLKSGRRGYLSLEDTVSLPDQDESAVIHKDRIVDSKPLPDVRSERADSARRLSELLEGLCARLIPREAKVIRRRFLNEKKETLEEIGTDFGVSRERIRQIQNEALRKLQIRICSSKGLEEECRDLLASLDADDRNGYRSVIQGEFTQEQK